MVIIFNKLHILVSFVGLISITEGESYVSPWSLHQKGSSDSILGFDARIKLTLLFHEDDETNQFEFMEWIPPSACDASSINNTELSLTCPQGGYYIFIKMRRKDSNDTITDSKYARFVDHPFCYRWYSFTEIREWENNGEVNLRLWVTDPMYQSTAEIASVAENPSEHSKKLTNLFQAGGQKPILSELFPETKEELRWNNISYNIGGYWTASIETGSERLQYLVMIEGKPGLAVNACLIRSTEVFISILKFQTNMSNESDLNLKGPPDLKTTVKDPCAMHVAISIRNDVLFTQNGFVTTSAVYVPNQFISVGDVLVDATFTVDKLYFLMKSGELIYVTTDGIFHSIEDSNIRGLTSITGTDTCLPSKGLPHRAREMILAWNDTQIYFAEDGVTFYELVMPENLTRISAIDEQLQVVIMDAVFSANVDAVNVILRVDDILNSSVLIICYKLSNQQWTRLGFWIGGLSVQDGFYMQSYSGNVESVVFWNGQMLFFSEHQGAESGTFTLKDRDDVNSSKCYSDTIENVEVCKNNHVFVRMKTGTLYCGTIEDKVLLEVSPLPPYHFVYCDVLGSAYSVYVQSNSTSKELVLRNAEMTSACHSAHEYYSCQFIDFETMTEIKAVYYLDINDTIFLWSRLTYLSSVFNDIDVFYSKMNSISVDERVNVDYNHGRKALNKSIIIQSTVNFYRFSDYNMSLQDATGLLNIQMKPLKTGVECLTERAMTTHVAVGCPPGRHIRVEKPVECPSFENFILPSGAYIDDNGETMNEDMIVHLDTYEYGCPLMSSLKTTMKPVLHLYDDEEFIEVVSVDYVLYELQRRTDFTYSATQTMVGCRRTSQSWNLMKEALGESSPLIWGPTNYRQCFVNDGTSMASSDLPYEILNHTGLSALQWGKTKLDQLYLFHLTVVDPNYSFCSLRTTFAVVVQGSLVGTQTSNNLTLFILVLFAAVTLSLVIASYALFRKGHMAEWKRNQAFEEEDMETIEEGEEMSQSEEAHMAAYRKCTARTENTILE